MSRAAESDLVTFWEETPIHAAVRRGDLRDLGAASGSGAAAHVHDALGWTPLHLAAVLDLDESITALVASGASIEALSHDGRTALGLAAAAGSARAVRTLLVAGAPIAVAGEARGVLADASTGQSLDVLQALADAGATTSEHVPYLAMALRLTGHGVWLGQRGYSRGLDEQPDRWCVDRPMSLPWSLLAPIGRQPDLVDGHPSSSEWVEAHSTMVWDGFATFDVVTPGTPGPESVPLSPEPAFSGVSPASLTFRSVRFGDARVTETMLIDVLEAKSPGLSLPRALPALIRLAHLDPTTLETQAPSVATKMFGSTIFQAAPGLLRALLEAGISPNLRTTHGLTPLMLVAPWGLDSEVDALLEHGADMTLRDEKGRTAADLARAAGKLTLAARLGFKGEPFPEGRTPLHHAALNHGDALRALLAAGADVRAVDAKGRTPLHGACQTSADHVRVLLAAGADRNAQDSSGRTPLHYAVALPIGFGSTELIAAGADVNIQDASGHTPLHHAVHLNKSEMVAELLAAGADPRIGDSTGETPFDHLDPRLGGGLVDAMWLADAQQHGPDRLASHLTSLIDAGHDLRIKMVLNPRRLASHGSPVAHRGALPLHEWTHLASELSAHCTSRGAWRGLHTLHVSGLPVAVPEAMRIREWQRDEICDSPPGEAALALLDAAFQGGAAVPFLLALDLQGCSPALDVAIFALCGSHVRSSSFEQDEPAVQTLIGATQALLAAGAQLEARNEDAASRVLTVWPVTDWQGGGTEARYPGLRAAADGLARPIGFTPLLQAAETCNPLLLPLLAAGADRRAVDARGRNALHIVCASGPAPRAVGAARALLALGFEADERSADGWRALTLTSNRDIAMLLLEHGASPDLDDDERRRLGSDGVRHVERMLER